jgi:beta-lactamase class D
MTTKTVRTTRLRTPRLDQVAWPSSNRFPTGREVKKPAVGSGRRRRAGGRLAEPTHSMVLPGRSAGGLLAALILATIAACGPARPSEAPPAALAGQVVELGHHLGGMEGTFVLLDGPGGRIVRHHPERAGTPFLPASTFKLPHSLIALETGVAHGPDFTLAWDSAVAPREGGWPPSHAEPQTLRSAFRGSVVWYFQEVARRVGEERMRAHLERWGYGNGDLSAGLDRFWLEGDFAISPDAQVEFVGRFLEGELGISARTDSIAREVFLLEGDAGAARLRAKTGTARLPEGRMLAWLVGWAECGGASHPFALNLEGPGDEVWNGWQAPRRIAAVRAMLGELGVCA